MYACRGVILSTVKQYNILEKPLTNEIIAHRLSVERPSCISSQILEST